MSRKKQVPPEVAAHRGAMGFMLAHAHSRFRARLAEALGEGPLHFGHVALLSSLFQQNDLTQVQLTQMSGIEKSSVVLFLDALEKDGWVERRPHATDRRAHAVHLTRKGRARFEDVGKRLGAAQEEALAEFSAAERKQLEALLVRLITHLS